MIRFLGVMIKIDAFFSRLFCCRWSGCFYANIAQTLEVFVVLLVVIVVHVEHFFFYIYIFHIYFFFSIFIYFCKSLLPKMNNDVTHHLNISFHSSLCTHQHLEFDVVVLKVLQNKKKNIYQTSHPIISHRITIKIEVSDILPISRFSYSNANLILYWLTLRYRIKIK